MVKETGNRIRILERWKFRFRFHSFLNNYAILCLIWQKFACGCQMSSASQLLFLWQTGSRYPILEVCEFQFWQCRDNSCHTFLRILAVLRLHLINPSSIEHKCLFQMKSSKLSRRTCHRHSGGARVFGGRIFRTPTYVRRLQENPPAILDPSMYRHMARWPSDDTIPYDTIRYIYVRSKAERKASLV